MIRQVGGLHGFNFLKRHKYHVDASLHTYETFLSRIYLNG